MPEPEEGTLDIGALAFVILVVLVGDAIVVKAVKILFG